MGESMFVFEHPVYYIYLYIWADSMAVTRTRQGGNILTENLQYFKTYQVTRLLMHAKIKPRSR